VIENKNKLRVYVSHSIRGVKGTDATDLDIQINCDRIKAIMKNLRHFTDKEIYYYVPAEHEEFIDLAFKAGYLTIEQILHIDCKIINACDVMLCSVEPKDDEVQGGRAIEVRHCEETDKTYFVFNYVNQAIDFINETMTKRGKNAITRQSN